MKRRKTDAKKTTVKKAGVKQAGVNQSRVKQADVITTGVEQPELNQTEINLIRELGLEIARRGAEPGMMVICHRTTVPPALPLTELLYDQCAWCDADLYYDRLMPNPPGTKRICVECYIALRQAEERERPGRRARD